MSLDHSPTTSASSMGATLNRRAFLASIGVAAGTSALAGCGASGAAGSPNTVSFFSWDGIETMQPVITAFEKANPGLKIDFSYAPPVPQYISTLQTRLGSHTAADVFIIAAENKYQIMGSKLAKDVSKENWTSNLAAAAKDTYTLDGALYGAAVSSWGGGILYNKAQLSKAGFSRDPATWSDFLKLCKQLKDRGITPFYEAGDGLSTSLAALLGLRNQQLGGNMSQDIWNGKLTFTKAWTPVLEQWNELFARGLESRVVAGLGSDEVTTEFTQGKVAMITTGPWSVPTIQKANPNLQMQFMAVPGDLGTYWSGAVSPGYAVNTRAKNPDGALKFVQFLVSKDGVAAYQKSAGAITTTKDYVPKVDPAIVPMVPAVRQGKFYLPAVSFPTHSDAIGVEVTALLQQLISGKIKSPDVTAGMDQKLKSLIG